MKKPECRSKSKGRMVLPRRKAGKKTDIDVGANCDWIWCFCRENQRHQGYMEHKVDVWRYKN